MSKLRKHQKVVDENIEIFKIEISILSYEKPILIAVGNDSHNILKNNLNRHEIHRIKHYSNWGAVQKNIKKMFALF